MLRPIPLYLTIVCKVWGQPGAPTTILPSSSPLWLSAKTFRCIGADFDKSVTGLVTISVRQIWTIIGAFYKNQKYTTLIFLMRCYIMSCPWPQGHWPKASLVECVVRDHIDPGTLVKAYLFMSCTGKITTQYKRVSSPGTRVGQAFARCCTTIDIVID